MQVDKDLIVPGNLSIGGTLSQQPRAVITKEAGVKYPIPFSRWRQNGAAQTALGGTSSGSDLAVTGGTFGTNTPALTTGNVHSSTVTRYARVVTALPAEYPAQETVAVVVKAGMQTTVADTSATVLIEMYKSNRDGTVSGSNLVTTSAQTINSLTFADITFAVNAATLNPGDEVEIRITIAVVDAATSAAVTAAVGAVALTCSIRG